MKERWLDPNCEYERPVDPKSRYVPTGPADIFAADKPGNGKATVHSSNGHIVADSRAAHMQEHKVKSLLLIALVFSGHL